MSFKKPLHGLKTSAPLRSTDARKLLKEIGDGYNISEHPDLVPQGIQIAKFITYLDAQGTLYTANGQPIWFRMGKGIDDVLLPTMYTLWKFPTLLPQLKTPKPVIEKLIGGADLMIPGVIVPPEGFPPYPVGQVVAIVAYGSQTPLAMGILAVPLDKVKKSETHGKAVHIIHTYKDHLFDLGDKSDPPVIHPNISNDNMENSNDKIADADRPENLSNHSLDIRSVEQDATEITNEVSNVSLSPSDVDEILKKSTFFALHKLIPNVDSLPMPASQFYSAHILPSRPTKIGEKVDIKKSSFKKLQKFLKSLEKSGYIKTKEIKGELTLMSFDSNLNEVKNFKPYKTIRQVNGEQMRSAQTLDDKRDDTAKMLIKECYKPHGKTLQLFQDQNKDPTELYDMAELRNIVLDYIKERDLVDKTNPKMIKINEILANAVLTKDEQRRRIEFVGRDQIVPKLSQNMQQWHSLQLGNRAPIVRKGSVQPIQIIIEQRVGRKIVTRVLNADAFGIIPDMLSEELKKRCASSTSITSLPLTTTKQSYSRYEVLVHGPQLHIVSEILLSRGIPKKYIEVMDKTKK